MAQPYEGDSNDPKVPGLTGKNTADGFGVRGDSPSGFAAVHGNGGKNGVWGYTVSANDSGSSVQTMAAASAWPVLAKMVASA